MTVEMCSELTQSPAPEINYFLQMIPCVDRASGRKIVVRQFDSGKLPPITLTGSRRLPHQLSAKEVEALIHTGMKDTWLLTGDAFGEPHWAAGLRYEQAWTRQGLRRGRLVATVPLGLNPASRKISVKTWETRRTKSTTTDLMETARTTEITGNERISASAQKQMLREQSAQYNPSATINNISIPVKGMADVGVGGSLGISATLGSLNRDTVTRAVEFIRDTTLKAVESIKSARTVVVEDEATSGIETTTAEELSNPNRVNTLTYLYYELEEQFEVTVTPVAIDLYLFLPLPVDPVISPEWLLVHECLLAPLIDCPALTEGFAAARLLVTLDRLEAQEQAALPVTVAPAAPGRADDRLKPVIAAIGAMISAYDELSGASLVQASFGKWVYWRTLLQFSEIIADACEKLKIAWTNASAAERNRSFVIDLITRFKTDIGNIDNAFLPVNIAVNAMVGVGTVVAYGPFSPFVYLMAQAADSVGADLLPDDANLEHRCEQMVLTMEALFAKESEAAELAVPVVDGTGEDAEADLKAAAIERERIAQQRRIDRAEARTRFEALQSYVRERKLFFHQVIWSHHDYSWIESQLRLRGIPPQLFDLRFAAFDGEFGALRLANLALAQEMGFDSSTLTRWQRELDRLRSTATARYTAHAPAPGVVVEPLIGTCMGGDTFVEAHRALDVERAAAEVRKLKAEAELAEKEVARLAARLERDMLDDPTPFEGPGTLVVHTRADDEPDGA
ncbi:MAG: hypothetical protein BroJett030_20570 [Alphaproteobacteria bacterium]|nr:MAG: hypothetical protein BroJett030_20570 [Alphaproteobacteria bacterium]